MMRSFVYAISMVMLAACSAAANRDGAAAYAVTGKGGPVVVLQSGLGDGMAVWDRVAPDLSHDYTVIRFDRPGRGGNPSTTAARNPCTIAAEQRALLQSAGLRPPYLLVGHSLGGLYQYVYARLYPAEVGGLVLLDPTHPRHWETMQREAPGAATMIRLVRTVGFSATDRREFDEQAACLDRLDNSRPLELPGRMLASGRFKPEERGEFERMVKRLRADWLRLTGWRELGIVPDAGHYIQKDSPEDVVAAIRQVAAEARTPR